MKRYTNKHGAKRIDNKKLLIAASVLLVVLIGLLILGIALKKHAKPAMLPEDASSVSQPVSSDPEPEPEPEPEPVSEPADNGIRLVLSSPSSSVTKTKEPSFTFTGTSDPAEPLTVNGNPVERNEQGAFSFTVALAEGKNTFTFAHKGATLTRTVQYRFVVIDAYYPSGAEKYKSGSTFVATLAARPGSRATATFNGQTVELQPTTQVSPEGTAEQATFINYSCIFTLPSDNTTDLSLGKITYSATYEGRTETFTSGTVTCLKAEIVLPSVPNATPAGGRYIDVGAGYVAEITDYHAETFNGVEPNPNAIDWSRPTNTYLPRGTVDYCTLSETVVPVDGQNKSYITLRSGQRIYTERRDPPNKNKHPVVSRRVEVLPDHNEIGVSSFGQSGSHTVLTLDTLWKAPFYFDMLPQSYTNPGKQDYSVSAATFTYLDITFCYATVFNGEVTVPEGHPIFSSAELFRNGPDCTLRLHLKKPGGFYGWDAYYNEAGQLCFEFLNPARISPAENEIGWSLSGVKILIDVGHGGDDIGAPGIDPNTHSEAVQNLYLANMVREKLEQYGATVIMSRTGNVTSSMDTKVRLLKQHKPDFCICIHHDSSPSGKAFGFSSYYSQPFSKTAAELVLAHTNSTLLYQKSLLGWHYYYIAQQSNCPIVLTENGFINNITDYGNIVSEAANRAKADAIAKGIAEYFIKIQ